MVWAHPDDQIRFFTPAGSAERRRAAESRRAQDRKEGTGGDEPSETSDDLLPPGWEPDIEGLDLAEGRAEESAAPRHPQNEVGSEGGAGDLAEEPIEDRSGERGEDVVDRSAGEMTSEEWARLRDMLGDGEAEREGEAYPVTADTPEVSEEEAAYAESGEEPDWLEPGAGRELTLDDLKKAPPEYRDLPGPTGHDVEAGAGAPTGEDARAAWGRGAEEGAEESATEETAAGEPTMAEVEAAADQLAEEFRGPEGARAPEGARPGQQAEPGEPTEYAEPAQGPMEPAEVEKQLLADLEEGGGPRTVRVGAAESLTGPTWEEPTSRPVMAEPTIPPGPGQARDMTAAVMTAAGLAAIGLISLLIAKWLFAIVATGVVVIGQMELYGTMHRRGHQPATALGLAVGALVMAAAYLKGEATMTFFLVLGLFLSFLWYMAAPLKARENLIRNVGATMLGVLYVPFLAGYVLLLLSQKNSGRALMVTVIALAFVYDIAAYFFGSFWGSRALAPTISPRKSWEGLLGATAVTLALSVALIPSAVDYLTVVRAIGLAVVIIVFAPLGDLVESLIKRDLGVKDMGSILPGHGGILDRIDSVLLVAPAAFYYLRLIF